MAIPPLRDQLKRLLSLHRGFQDRLLPTTAWSIGQQLQGCSRKDIDALSKLLAVDFGTLASAHNLRETYRFWKRFPYRAQISNRLYWTHYRLLSRIREDNARQYYHRRAVRELWSSRELQRQIRSRRYERQAHASQPLPGCLVLEFANSPEVKSELALENRLMLHLQQLLLELGDGWAFVARQKRLITDSGKPFFVDLVFYHLYLRCFVLFELKVGELSHRDIGQIDWYVRYFDQHFRLPGDAPTIGIILCRSQDQTLVRYSLLNGNPRLWSATYQLHLPSEEEWAAWSNLPPPDKTNHRI